MKMKENSLVTLYKNDDAFVSMKKIGGKMYREYRRNWKQASDMKDHFNVPLHLDLDTSNVCNMGCRNCNAVTAKSGTRYDMDIPLLKRRLQEAIPKGIRSINFGNCSEPLLCAREMFDLIAMARPLGIVDIFIHTNGLLLTPKMAEKITQSGVTKLCISLDAATEKTFQVIGRKGFQTVIDNVERFLEYRSSRKSRLPILRVSFCPNPHNLHEIKEFKRQWSHKADLVEIQSLYKMHKEEKLENVLEKNSDRQCPDPWRRLVIWPNNTYGACCQYFAFHSGNILNLGPMATHSIEEIWRSSQMVQIRRTLAKGPLLKECRECFDSRFRAKGVAHA